MPDPTVRIEFRSPPDLATQFRNACTQNGTTMTNALLALMAQYVKTQKGA